MNNRKTEKMIKNALKQVKKEKKICEKLYPDWRDDDYNALHNYFIWGITDSGSTNASFATLNNVCIYYNRSNKKYFLDIDLTGYDMDEKCRRLEEALCALHKHIFDSNEVRKYTELTDDMLHSSDFYMCDTIQEAYFKLRILTVGIENYWQSGDNLINKAFPSLVDKE